MREEAAERLFKWFAEHSVEKLDEAPPPASLLKLRTALGFTQAALAAKLGLKEPIVRRVETGNMPVSIEVATRYRQLAEQNGLDLDQLAV